MTKIPLLIVVASAALILSVACATDHAEPQNAETETLGAVNFPTSCEEDVAEIFTRGIAFLHSFEYPLARAEFQAVAEQDPECGMAYWGVAMTYYHPIWPDPADEFTAGASAAANAESIGAATDRERAYIAAIGAFYGHGEERLHGVRARAWYEAMHDLSERFPDDTEAAIFYALSLLATLDPTDSTLGNQKQAAAILNELWPDQPNHPGIAHYLIHSLDYPALADQGLPAARLYASVAPSSAHALHMPSHIFTRVGLWDESIATNINSRDAARRLVEKSMPGAISDNELHAQDHLAYAYLQIDDQAGAKAVVDEVSHATSLEAPGAGGGYALTAIPARWALERRDWEAAAAVEFPVGDLPWERFPYVRAITPFARALGAARTGQIDEARAEVEKIRLVQLGLAESPVGGVYNWTNQVESMRLAAAAWLAYAEKRTDEAVELARSAAELDEATGKHPVTPGSVLPPRELLADLLLELNRPAEALVEYERSLRQAPNRFNSFYGAARSAELSNNPAKAKEHYSKLVEMTVDASARSEVEQARAFLKGSS